MGLTSLISIFTGVGILAAAPAAPPPKEVRLAQSSFPLPQEEAAPCLRSLPG